jgi:ribosome maturation factor RimP
MGAELWGVEFFVQGKYSALRIYIDKTGGVTLDELGAISAQLNALLDVEDLISGEYRLEISSPGIERQLFFLAQCERYVGCQLKVKTHTPVNEQRNFSGELQTVTETEITLRCEQQAVVLDWGQIEKAMVSGEMKHGK